MDVTWPHHIDVSKDARVDLRERIAATRWSDVESHGMQLATIRGGEGKLPFPRGAIIESNEAVHPFVERGRDKSAVERLLAESFIAASAADVQFMVKGSKK
jgi:hypothetical protein